jgi:hypothetical protein
MLLVRWLLKLILALSITRAELSPDQRYGVTGSVYNSSRAVAQLIAPQGVIVYGPNPVIIDQASPDPVTLHWVIEIGPRARKNIPLPLTLKVNDQEYTISIRVIGYAVYLPIAYN